LYHWTDHPIAIATSESLGEIYSGSSWVDNDNVSGLFPSKGPSGGKDNVLAYFTSHTSQREAQYLAFSLDGGESFKPYEGNPIIDLSRSNFRDPKVSWHKESKSWVMVLTFTDSVTFYTSTDLVNWTRRSDFAPTPGVAPFIECPQLIRLPRRRSAADTEALGTAWMLLFSTASGYSDGRSAVKYIVGNFDGQAFTPTSGVKIFDFGPDVYATAFFHFPGPAQLDGTRNAVSMSWAVNLPYGVATPTCSEDAPGWRNAQTAPRTHWLDANDKLVAVPADTAALRVEERTVVDKTGAHNLTTSWPDLASEFNPALEFVLTIHAKASQSDTSTGSLAFSSSTTAEQLLLSLEVSGDSLNLTVARTGMQGFNGGGWNVFSTQVGPARSGADERAYDVHGFLDRSLMEVYINGGTEFGTFLYFAQGVLDTASLQQPQEAGNPGELGFDLKIVPLRSVWGNGP
jgi:beta-fructofuranosidase